MKHLPALAGALLGFLFVAFNVFITKGQGLFTPMGLPFWIILVLFLLLMWLERAPFTRAVISRREEGFPG